MTRPHRAVRRLLTRAGLLGALALLPAGVLAGPAHAGSADPARPTLSASVTVSPPSAPTEPLVCDYNRINCGTVTVAATLSNIEAFPRGHYVARLSGTARLSRVYGCENARGRRLHRYDTVVRQDVDLDNRRGLPFSVDEGATEVTTSTFVFPDDAQPGTCPAGTTPYLFRMTLSRIRLELRELVAPQDVFRYCVRGRSSWSGAVPTQPTSQPAPAAA